ncbi:glycerate kinase [Thermonema rossianum]|uniref:glycerate kinase n=1 Tax=Thermonema rossianum TaxID=55505 RepID=UPI000691BA98|nr:glycerate kinase [Thermonema rossianum]
MRWLIACDKFKEALSAQEVCEQIALGLQQADTLSAFSIDCCPLSDGGDGFLQVMHKAVGGEWQRSACHDALLQPHEAMWLWLPNEQTAFIEVAAAAGLAAIPAGRRNPHQSSSYGVGELIRAAVKQGARHIYVGIGGSASHDLGLGLAAALGVRFFNAQQKTFIPTAHTLQQIERVEVPGVLIPPHCRIEAICDVQNPLVGNEGAAFTYALQKGFRQEELSQLEAHTQQAVNCLASACPQARTIAQQTGSGAGGGIAFGLAVFLGAPLTAGVAWIAEKVGFARRLQQADIVITGEGKLDNQSRFGKVTHFVGHEAQKQGKLCAVFCGSCELSISGNHPYDYVCSILPAPMSLEEALAQTADHLHAAAFQFGKLMTNGKLRSLLLKK